MRSSGNLLLVLVMAGGWVPSEDEILGRWDVTVNAGERTYPSWFEISREGGQLSGRFVGGMGSARPIPNLQVSGGSITFSVPPQYEPYTEDLHFEGQFRNGRLEGTTNAADGSVLHWTAVRAPELKPPSDPKWGEPVALFNGSDLSGWKVRSPELANNWKAEDGVLVNAEKGTDLITEASYENFKLQLEFNYPEGSNSGIYLRGRYEVQVQDDIGKEPSSVLIGGVYGFVTPTENAAKPAGEWQSYEMTLLGRRITIVLNGKKVIDNQEIPGITGGALDSAEGTPGPFMLQGDHGPVSFRNIVLTPVEGG